MNQIPFRYECKLQLDETIIYPDFIIRHPITGKIYYWEHLGKMDDEVYRHRNSCKLEIYNSNQIYPSLNLILTYETKDCPLDAEYVNTLISHYFL